MRALASLVLFFFAIFSVPASADCNAGSCVGVGDEVLASIYPVSGKIYLEPPTATDKAALNCTLVSGQFMTLEMSHTNYEAIYSTILTAIATGVRLQVRIVEGSSTCEVSYVRMYL